MKLAGPGQEHAQSTTVNISTKKGVANRGIQSLSKRAVQSTASSSGAPLSMDDVNGLQPYEAYLRELHIARCGYNIMTKRLLQDRTVLCPQRCMRTWTAVEKAHAGQEHAVATTMNVRKRQASCVVIIEISSVGGLAPHAAFMVGRVEAGAGWRGLTTALDHAHNVRCSCRTFGRRPKNQEELRRTSDRSS